MKRACQNIALTLFLAWTAHGCATQSQQAEDGQGDSFQDDELGDEGDDEDLNQNAGKQGGDDDLKNNEENGEFDLAAENSGNVPYVDKNGADNNLSNINLGNGDFGDANLFGNGGDNAAANQVANATPDNAPPSNDALLQNAPLENQTVIEPVANGAQGQAAPNQTMNANPAPVANNTAVPLPANTAAEPAASPGTNSAANGASLLDAITNAPPGGSTLRSEFLSGNPDDDVGPTYAQLRWVGYNFEKDARRLKVEIVTVGNPTYEFFQERNRIGQPELVIRFYETELREKTARPLDASEFRSPVAYVRMRPNVSDNSVDVVLTLRDQVKPLLFAKDGSVRLTFDIPDYYFGNSAQEVAQKIGSAETLALANVFPEMEAGSDAPRRSAFVPDPAGQAFDGASDEAGTPVEPEQESVTPDPSQLPDSFDEGGGNLPDETLPQTPANELNNFESRAGAAGDDALAAFHIATFSIAAVAQDGNAQDEDFEDEGDGANGGNNANANGNLGNNQNNNGNLNANGNNINANNINANNINANNINANNVNANGNANANANFAEDPETINGSLNGNTAPLNNGAPAGNVPANNALPLNNTLPLNNAPLNNAPVNNAAANQVVPPNNGGNQALNDVPANVEVPPPDASTAAPDIAGSETEGAPRGDGTGRPVSIEFHRAPLHLVLKSFGEESGNNFIYPTDVANTEITIRLRQVPWDEALKAILETYGLGMVQVGQNVVRIDRLAKMNEYLKDLNTVRQYREQLEPTKILVLRLSHGTAKDVVTQMAEMLKTDIEKDPRIKITADERTNSIVAEAATATLSKIKNVLERLDLETPQVRIASRIVEVSKTATNFFGILWSNTFNFDPGRGLGLGSLPFPNSVNSDFTVDPGVSGQATSGNLTMRFGSLNRFIDLDLLLKMEERKGTTNILQNNNVLVLDRQRASILAGSSQFFRPAAGGNVITQGGNAGGQPQGNGLAEVTFNLSLDVVPQVTAAGNINMKLIITSDTPGDPTGEQLATKNTRRLETMMTRRNGETAVIGGIYDTKRTKTVVGVPYLSDIPILGLLFKSTLSSDTQTELLIMVTPTLVGLADNADAAYQNGFAAGAPTAPAGTEDADFGDEGEGELQSDNVGNDGGNGGNTGNSGNPSNGGGNGGGNGATATNSFGGNVEVNF